MNAFAGFSSAAFKPNISTVIHLVGTETDAIRMGGTLNNVYFTAQAAYDAAVALGVACTIYVYETTAAQVGDINLTSNWNSNVRIMGQSPVISEIGNIIGDNGSGTGRTISIALISGVTVGNITANATSVTLNNTAGSITLGINNCTIGNVEAKGATGGTGGGGGNITITGNTRTALKRISYINSIVTQANSATAGTGTVSIDAPGLRLGTLTVGGGTASSGGGITNVVCDYIGSVSITRQVPVNTSFNAREIGTFSYNITGATTSNETATINSCRITGAVTTNIPAGSRLRLILRNCQLQSTCTFTGDTLVQAFSTSFGQDFPTSFTTGIVTNVGNNSKFTNCSFFSSTACIAGLGTGVVFIGCDFSNGSSQNTFTNSTAVTVSCLGCNFSSKNTDANVAIISEREFVGTVTTTNASTATLFTMPVPTGQRMRIVANVTATIGTSASFTIIANIAKNNSGTLTLVGSPDSTIGTPIAEAAFTGSSIAFVTSGTNMIVQVTGIAATTINWTGSFKVFSSF